MIRKTQKVGTAALALACTLALVSVEGCRRDPNVRKQRYLDSGIRFEKDGKLQEATIQIANALKIDPAFAAAHYEMSKVYLKLGTPVPAYQELMRTVELQPSNAAARLDLGSLLLSGNVPARAMEQVKLVLAADPNNADAFALRAAIEQKQGDTPAALQDIHAALAHDPNKAKFHTLLAVIEAGNGAAPSKNSEDELQKAIQLDPASMLPRLMLAGLLEKRGDVAGAEQQYLAAIKATPKSLEPRSALASLYVRTGALDKAERTLKTAALEQNTTEAAPELLRSFYVQTKQLNQAPAAFADLTRAVPGSVPLQVSYARALLQVGDTSKAKAVLAELSKSHDQSAPVVGMNAMLLARDGNLKDALALVHKGIKNNPDSVPLQVVLGELSAQNGDLAAAETAFRDAGRMDPSNLQVQTGMANVALRRNDFTLLAQVANNALVSHPDAAAAYLWRGTAEANQGQLQQANADFEEAVKRDPSAIALTELGQLRIKQNRVPEGKALLEQALDKDPNATRALAMLVGYDLGAKNPAGALARVQKQLSRSPNNATLYTDVAVLQMEMHDYPAALANVNTAMKLDPSNQIALQTFTQLTALTGQTDQAIGGWEKWVASHPNAPQGQVMLGTLEEARGDTEKAATYYRRALQLDPTNGVAANNLAYLSLETGQNADVALTLAQTARRAMPDSPSTADTLAWALYHKGTYASARDLLEDAVKLQPNNTSIQYHLGMTYLKLNDKSNARVHLDAADKAAPGSKTADEARKALASMG